MKRHKRYRISIQAFAVLTIISIYCGYLAEAKTRYIKDGKEYGIVQGSFRHRWWNYYERGLSFTEGRFYEEAIQDLKEAIKQREKDQRMARTYGMHFVDYFPNRELGITYFDTGNFTEAQKFLDRSLTQFPSEKARYYLNEIRKVMIKQIGGEATPPTLTLDVNEIRTNADPVIISGYAKDLNYISEISVDDVPLFLKYTQQDVKFEKTLSLDQREHHINITAKNLAGKTTNQKVIIHVDLAVTFIMNNDLD